MVVILVASTDRDFRELIVFALRFTGYKVFYAVNRFEFDQLAHESRPNLILVDESIILADGHEGFNSFVDGEEIGSTQVIILVDKAYEWEMASGNKLRRVEYIHKPISVDILTKKVNQLLSKR